MTKGTVAILYVVQGNDFAAWDNFYRSSEEFLLPGQYKQYFVFSDDESITRNTNVSIVRTNGLKDSKSRIWLFSAIENQLAEFTCVYAFSSHIRFVSSIVAEDITPTLNSPFVVYRQYPNLDHVLANEFPYERAVNANSYVPYGVGDQYLTCALFGGMRDSFISACRCIDAAIEDDRYRHIASLNAEDKQLNQYFLYKNNMNVLSANWIRKANEPWKRYTKMLDVIHKEDSFDIPVDVLNSVKNIHEIFRYAPHTSFLDLQENVAKSWRALLKAYLYGQLMTFDFSAKKPDLVGKNIIWQYWGQGIDDGLPELTKVCFASVDRNKGDYTVIRVDDTSLAEYIDLPDFMWQKRGGAFSATLFSDVVRLVLLYVYGGIWVDATIIFSSPLPKELLEQDFFLFHRDIGNSNKAYWERVNKDYFCWDKEHKVNSLNSFIIAKPQHIVTETLLQLLLNYWKTQEHVPCYYIFQILFDQMMKYDLDNQRLLIRDDTFPHELVMKLWSDYNAEEINDLFSRCSVHKLTGHANLADCGENSVWQHLKREYLG